MFIILPITLLHVQITDRNKYIELAKKFNEYDSQNNTVHLTMSIHQPEQFKRLLMDFQAIITQDPYPALPHHASSFMYDFMVFSGKNRSSARLPAPHEFALWAILIRSDLMKDSVISSQWSEYKDLNQYFPNFDSLQTYYHDHPKTTDDIHMFPHNPADPGFLLSYHQELKSLFDSFLASEPQRRAAQQLGQDFAEITPFNSDVVSIITAYLITNKPEAQAQAVNKVILNHFVLATTQQSAAAQIQDGNRSLCTIL